MNADFRSVALRFEEAKRCFELDVEALAKALGPQTAALIVNTPLGWPSAWQFPELEVVSIDLVLSCNTVAPRVIDSRQAGQIW